MFWRKKKKQLFCKKLIFTLNGNRLYFTRTCLSISIWCWWLSTSRIIAYMGMHWWKSHSNVNFWKKKKKHVKTDLWIPQRFLIIIISLLFCYLSNLSVTSLSGTINQVSKKPMTRKKKMKTLSQINSLLNTR